MTFAIVVFVCLGVVNLWMVNGSGCCGCVSRFLGRSPGKGPVDRSEFLDDSMGTSRDFGWMTPPSLSPLGQPLIESPCNLNLYDASKSGTATRVRGPSSPMMAFRRRRIPPIYLDGPCQSPFNELPGNNHCLSTTNLYRRRKTQIVDDSGPENQK